MPRQAGSCLSSQTLGIARVRIKMRNTRSAFASGHWATAAHAARPASLASSARPVVLHPGERCCTEPLSHARGVESLSWAVQQRPIRWLLSAVGGQSYVLSFAGCRAGEFGGTSGLRPCFSSASRRSASQGCSGHAATSFSLFASVATQRTMRAGSVVLRPLPNPSIERTCPGKPGHASHLKR